MKHRPTSSRAREARANPKSPREVDKTQPVYASDVQVLIEPGSVHLVFTRFQAAPSDEASELKDLAAGGPVPMPREIVGRIVLPPLAAERLLRVLPGSLAAQQALADEYASATDIDGSETLDDPFLAALESAEIDDEPYTAEQQALTEAGRQEFLRGETITWDELKKQFVHEADAKLQASG